MAVIHYGHICLASPKADQPLSEDRGMVSGSWGRNGVRVLAHE